MFFGRHRFLLILLSGLAVTVPARAQENAPVEPARTWTDPPARGASGPSTKETSGAPSSAPGAAKPVSPEPTAAKSENKASRIRVSRAQTRAPRRVAVHTPRRAVAPERPHLVVRRAVPPVRVAAVARPRSPWTTRGHAIRTVSSSVLPVGRMVMQRQWDGSDYGGTWEERSMWGGYPAETRRRVARARAAGYLIMRSQTVETPEGYRYRTLRSLDDGEDGPD